MRWPGQADLEIKVATLVAQLAAEVDRRDRAELELSRLREDFNELVKLTSGRIPPKLAPDFGGKDPFGEDESIPETFLTPDPDELEMAAGEQAVELIAQANG